MAYSHPDDSLLHSQLYLDDASEIMAEQMTR